MKYFILAGFLFMFRVGACQDIKQVDSLYLFINKLGWTSFEISNNYIQFLTLNDSSRNLIALKNEKKISELLKNISDSNKTVAIHIVLTQIIEPMNSALTIRYVYANDSTISSIIYTYNGLTWYYDNKRDHNYISKKNMLAIEKYWQEKITQK